MLEKLIIIFLSLNQLFGQQVNVCSKVKCLFGGVCKANQFGDPVCQYRLELLKTTCETGNSLFFFSPKIILK